uniref:Corazonin n=1 Tax=Ophionotus victoriae TaxID=667017 RepID=A0A220W0A8_9ECHI|nr:corazonin precursor [Ophionotus victoriae]
MRNCSTIGAALLLAVILGSILGDAHNTFSFKGSNRWNAGKRAQMDNTHGLTDRLTDTSNNFVPKESAATTLRQLLVDLRDYCDSLVRVLDESRIESERK